MKKASAHLLIVNSVALFCCMTIYGQVTQNSTPGKLSVNVSDAVGVPITDAFVLAHSGYGKRDGPAKLIQNGRFEILLEPGIYDVFVASAGFAPLCKALEISSGQTTVLHASLHPDDEHLQPSSRKKYQ